MRIALIGQFPVPVDGLVTAPPQLLANRRFSCCGTALYEEVSPTHAEDSIQALEEVRAAWLVNRCPDDIWRCERTAITETHMASGR